MGLLYDLSPLFTVLYTGFGFAQRAFETRNRVREEIENPSLEGEKTVLLDEKATGDTTDE